MAITEGVKEAIWLGGLLRELGVQLDHVNIHSDNQSAIMLTKHHVYHERTKHIDVRFYFIRDIIAKGVVKIKKIHTSLNASDAMTKALPGPKFRFCMDLVGVKTLRGSF